jgi:serine/threonine protein kinase
VYERLGTGGMATVCRAKKRGPEGFERSVALKRMLSHLAEDPHFVESFIREAKVASLLQHPHIAQVYDFGRISGVYYIAMELVAGFDVRKLLRYANRANEAIPLQVVLSILGELCDALDYAHTFVDEAGQAVHIVHRDVSPSNLIVAHTGHLKVIDFGIAKANTRQLHTESGHVKGKLGYMSPEVALGMNVGPVSDVFSVGVVAWELVTAMPLFSARTDFETVRKVREQPIMPPSKLNPSIPPTLDQTILAALHRDPDRRLASATLLRQAIDQVAAETKTHISARAVSDWMLKFVQPDAWSRATASRARSPSGGSLPLPPERATALLRGSRRVTQLHRSPDDIQLATEIWGEDVHTIEEKGAQPDFHRHVATPPPAQMPSSIQPLRISSTSLRPSRAPLVVLGVLAIIAGALGAILYHKHQTSEPAAITEHDRQSRDQAQTETASAAPAPPPGRPEPVAITVPPKAATSEPKRPAKLPKQTKRATAKIENEKQVAEVETPKPEPKEPEPKPPEPKPPEPPKGTSFGAPEEPLKTEPKIDLPKIEPPKLVEARPARTPVVAASAVTKLSGEVPALRAKNAEDSGNVLAKMCIDEQGNVSSVKIVKSNPEIAAQLQSALITWRYKPYMRDGKPAPVCFPLSLRVVVKSNWITR